MQDMVILVNEQDEQTGLEEKISAHEKGLLHRAISVFISNSDGKLLIQQRANGKYHSGGLWSNTCCSHPLPGEDAIAAASRRLKEELGFACALSPAFILRYKADMDKGLVENEYDHVFTGAYDGAINANPNEVQDQRYVNLYELCEWMEREPHAFTAWFRLALPRFITYLYYRRAA